MDWTDIKTTVPAQYADTAEAIATGISGGGIYIEDYRDLEAQVEAIAHVDLIEQEMCIRDSPSTAQTQELSDFDNLDFTQEGADTEE